MIRCYRKVYQFANDGWFWLWTSTLIYANTLCEMIYGKVNTALPSMPIVTSESDIIYIIGDFAKEHVIASTIILPDGSEVDFDESHLHNYKDTPVTAGKILSKHGVEYSPDSTLSVIMMDGRSHKYSWDEPLILRCLDE